MKKTAALTLAVLAALFLAQTGFSQEVAVAVLDGFQQVPAAITPGSGVFSASINEDRTEISYSLSYQKLRGDILQAHLHLAQENVNGGIMVFICTNFGNGPAGTPPCPAGGEGEVSGTWTVDSVVPVAGQGLSPGAARLNRVVRAMRNGVAYANVHTSMFPPGEIRGQIRDTSRPALRDEEDPDQ